MEMASYKFLSEALIVRNVCGLFGAPPYRLET
jgi:hypothetical protein